MDSAKDTTTPPTAPLAPAPRGTGPVGIGRLQELVLRAVCHLGRDCGIADIRAFVLDAFGHAVAFGAVFTTLDRLEGKGLVTHGKGLPASRRGGRAPRLYTVSPAAGDVLDGLDRISAAAGSIRPPAPGALKD